MYEVLIIASIDVDQCMMPKGLLIRRDFVNFLKSAGSSDLLQVRILTVVTWFGPPVP